ncbi:DUF3060 domain-containing protein [Curtobacterium sp. VKM Ac-1395]|uniref:DUF3060 domain-containing protein n=1 Tax=Curtobacterium sp. VKM Ac-1395 TaxID=2783815 RepID=UPI00188D8AF6|nr:DUF3060 domain-containing protein [Curtobacterium sp. VKM Ac-1395]MBF4589218.1 DUF3060 domain-containing protein [Curtobacterium sp. VKM Ac-1395]
MRTTTRIGITITASVLAAVALAGCSGNGDSTATKTPTASPTVATATGGVADDTGACVDRVSTPIKSKAEFSIDSCDFVDVMGTGNTITAGKLEKLIVEGDGNTITVKSVKEVTTSGKDNTIYYSGSEPTHHEVGSGTTLAPVSSKK